MKKQTGISGLSGCVLGLLALLWLIGCGADRSATPVTLTLPPLTAAELSGRRLRVVAATSIIGDVVGQIGGDAIELTTLIGSGQDPHSYQPTPGDRALVEAADVLFINGWDLESQIDVADAALVVPISAGIEPLRQATNGGRSADPHVWLAVDNVAHWARNAETVLSGLDPANRMIYQANLNAYLQQLAALDEEVRREIAQIAADRRKIVTNHEALAYFADAYGFEIVGAVIPGSSSAQPSAGQLAALIELMRESELCTIFGEGQSSSRLAETVAQELDYCPETRVLALSTDALGSGEASSYLGMMRANVRTIVEGLR